MYHEEHYQNLMSIYKILDVTAYYNAWFGQGSILPILMDDVNCDESETQLIDCSHDANTADCSHSDDAGARCHSRK